jgi:hypothetical protein
MIDTKEGSAEGFTYRANESQQGVGAWPEVTGEDATQGCTWHEPMNKNTQREANLAQRETTTKADGLCERRFYASEQL